MEDEGKSLLWVDKYRPQSLKNLIGQQGEQSCANKLLRWLQNWHKRHSGNVKPAGQRLLAQVTAVKFCALLCCFSLCVHCILFLFFFIASKFGRFGGKDDGSAFKAALLSGPPGIGKTTTAALVCEVSLVQNGLKLWFVVIV